MLPACPFSCDLTTQSLALSWPKPGRKIWKSVDGEETNKWKFSKSNSVFSKCWPSLVWLDTTPGSMWCNFKSIFPWAHHQENASVFAHVTWRTNGCYLPLVGQCVLECHALIVCAGIVSLAVLVLGDSRRLHDWILLPQL